jgi:CHAD domain-containing protein
MSTLTEELAGYLRAQRDALVAMEPAVRVEEPDSVHRMRVATRRLRSALRTFRPLLDVPAADALRAELAWLADTLGVVRDCEVTTSATEEALAGEPDDLIIGPVRRRVLIDLAATAVAGRALLLAELDADRYRTLLADLDAFTADPVPAEATDRQVQDRVHAALRRAEKLLDRALSTDRGEDPPPEAVAIGMSARDYRLHEARKAVKRARYAVEVVAPAVGRPATRLVRRLTALQDALGAHHDTITARQRLLDWSFHAFLARENGFTYGLLYARQQAIAARLEAGLPALARAAFHRAFLT